MNIGLSFPTKISHSDGSPADTKSSLLPRFDPTTGKKVMDIIAKMRNSAPAAGRDEIFFISRSKSH